MEKAYTTKNGAVVYKMVEPVVVELAETLRGREAQVEGAIRRELSPWLIENHPIIFTRATA